MTYAKEYEYIYMFNLSYLSKNIPWKPHCYFKLNDFTQLSYMDV